MITEKAIAVYKRFDGDIDSWARYGTSKDKLALTDQEWFIIDSLLQDLKLIESNFASEDYINKIETQFSLHIEGESAISLLKSLV